MSKVRICTYLTIVLVTVLLNPCTLKAANISDLKALYNLSTPLSLSSNVLDTISDYNEMRIQMAKWGNVLNMLSVSRDSVEYKKLLDEYNQRLLAAYDLDFNTIIQLESEYIKAYNKYDAMSKPLTVSLNTISFNNISSNDYVDAKTTLDDYQTSCTIGDLLLNNVILEDIFKVVHTRDATIITTNEGDVFYAPYNCTVKETTFDSILLELPDYITLKIKGITSITVDVGEDIIQGQPLGLANETVIMGFNFNDKYYSCDKVLKDPNQIVKGGIE